jgi:hypothetical protein
MLIFSKLSHCSLQYHLAYIPNTAFLCTPITIYTAKTAKVDSYTYIY